MSRMRQDETKDRLEMWKYRVEATVQSMAHILVGPKGAHGIDRAG